MYAGQLMDNSKCLQDYSVPKVPDSRLTHDAMMKALHRDAAIAQRPRLTPEAPACQTHLVLYRGLKAPPCRQRKAQHACPADTHNGSVQGCQVLLAMEEAKLHTPPEPGSAYWD